MNVLICAMDAPGLAYQAVGLAKEIEARGHRAVVVSSATVAEIFARHGVTRIPRPRSDGHSFRLWKWTAVEATLLQVLHIEHAARSFRPDLIVASPLGFGPALAAERLGVPLVVIGGLTFLWDPGTWRHDEGWHYYLAGRAALGLAAPPAEARNGYAPWLGEAFLLQSSPSLTGPLRWPRCRWAGDCSWDPPVDDPELVAWLDAADRRGRRVVYLQTGREFGAAPLLGMLEEAAHRLELSFAVSTGHGDSEPTQSSDWLWARPLVPRATALPRSVLVVGSGQPTTVLGALGHGLPCVLVWSGSGTEEAADACRRRGVALAERLVDASPSRITGLLQQALADPDLGRSARDVGTELRALGGLGGAAAVALEIARS